MDKKTAEVIESVCEALYVDGIGTRKGGPILVHEFCEAIKSRFQGLFTMNYCEDCECVTHRTAGDCLVCGQSEEL